jgi:hypothetical protein
MVRGTTARLSAARINLVIYLRALGEVPAASNARAAAMRERARNRLSSRNNQRMGRDQVFPFIGFTTFRLVIAD